MYYSFHAGFITLVPLPLLLVCDRFVRNAIVSVAPSYYLLDTLTTVVANLVRANAQSTLNGSGPAMNYTFSE